LHLSFTKAWQLQQVFVDFTHQKRSDVCNLVDRSFTNGTGITKELHHDWDIRLIRSTAECKILLFGIGLAGDVVSSEGCGLTYVVAPSPPDPLLTHTVTKLDFAVVAEERRYCCFREGFDFLRFALLVVPADFGLWKYLNRVNEFNNRLPRRFSRKETLPLQWP